VVHRDWRNVNGTNYCSRVLNQKNPAVCGSCWAEAATGALTDRYNIATNNIQAGGIQLAPQNLLNFNSRVSGGSCNGGDPLKAYDFIHSYGISDDTCSPYAGLNWLRGFEVAAMTSVEDVQGHQCYTCNWNGVCEYVPKTLYNLYSVDEFGTVQGEEDMMAEIYARGPIACMINSESEDFCRYKGGVLKCDDENDPHCKVKFTDHVVVIAGWGVEAETGMPYWVGRNSYGTQWGEGVGGGWFRVKRGENLWGIEGEGCAWAVPAAADVKRLQTQWEESVNAIN
jgi:cathepsin X